MCGRFAQIESRDDYLSFLAEEATSNIAYDPQPIGRYNVAPDTKVLLLNICMIFTLKNTLCLHTALLRVHVAPMNAARIFAM
jgi:putative SOS response-associated peptidase YedK